VNSVKKNELIYELHSESVLRPLQEKFRYIANLIFDACKLKSEVRKLKNHPANSLSGHILMETYVMVHKGFEQQYAKEIFEFCDDFKRTRNIELKIQVEHIKLMTQEILDGNYDYDRDYFLRHLNLIDK